MNPCQIPLRSVVLIGLLIQGVPAMSDSGEKLKALLIDGQMNEHHDMGLMSGAVKSYLEETGLFDVAQLSTPPAGEDMSGFAPEFTAYDLVVLNYDGADWPSATRSSFEAFVRGGGGLVTVHSTDNAFPDWQAFVDMTGVGGWGGRDENWGPSVHWGENGLELDHGPGRAFHPKQHPFPVTVRDAAHPVTADLPGTWLHAYDELYSGLRGPAENMVVLATGFADPSLEKTSGRHEPVLMAVSYGEGRVFHTTLGHIGRKETALPASVRCTGFITTLQRGAEWAATGEVTQPVPVDLPGADEVSLRP